MKRFIYVFAALLISTTTFAAQSEDSRNIVDFVRSGAETRFNLDLGPFALGSNGKYGLVGGGAFEFWNLQKSYIQSIGAKVIRTNTTSINVFGAFYFEGLPRLYVGPILGIDYKEQTGFGAISLRLLGSDPSAQSFFSILYSQFDLGLRSSSTPYAAISFGFKLF